MEKKILNGLDIMMHILGWYVICLAEIITIGSVINTFHITQLAWVVPITENISKIMMYIFIVLGMLVAISVVIGTLIFLVVKVFIAIKNLLK